MTQPRTISLLGIGAVLAGLMVLGAGPASAQPVATRPASAHPVATEPAVRQGAPAEATVPTMIVLDASGSMKTDDAPGPRIDAAKSAVTSLINTLPVGAPVGLQVYGTATGSSDAEKAAGCTDIKTLVPVGPLDPATMAAAVSGIQASGYTPIGNALKAAADALPNEGPRSIVLVSDGEDTCAPPAPCDVAKELKQSGIDLTVHTVGFKVDQTARDQLTCIAENTGGSYSDATDAVQLDAVLTRQVQDALAGYTVQGTPVTGLDQLDPQAPLLNPGQYTDTMALGETDTRDGTIKYYRVPMYPGARPYIAVTTVLPTDEDVEGWKLLGVEVSLVDIDGDVCRSASADFSQLGYGNYETPTTVLSPDLDTSDCGDRDVVFLRLERRGEAYADRELTIEIATRIEPPADSTGLPEEAELAPDLPAPVLGAASPIVGGRSFNDAPLLTDTATYTDTLATGDSRYYRVRLDWGQRLTYLVKHTGPAQPQLTNGSAVTINVFNPVRQQTGSVNTAIMFEKSETVRTDSTPVPVRYNNRENGFKQSMSLDGEYYLVLTADRPDGNTEPSTTTFSFTTVVSGQVDPAPKYELPGSVPGVTTTQSSPDPSTAGATTAETGTAETGTAETGTAESDVSSNAGDVETSVADDLSDTTTEAPSVASSAMTAATDDSDPLNVLWWLTGGLFVLAIVGGGFALIRSRRRS